jgi:hypothetical protein
MTEPTKHRHARPKRAARPAGKRVAGAEDQASQIREAVSGRGSRSARSGSSSALAWFRTVPGMVAFAVVILGLAFVVRLVATGSEDDKLPGASANPTAPGARNASYGNRWTSPDGFRYEISVATLNDLVAVGSPSTCVATPTAGVTTNLHFTVTVKNRSKKDAPVPAVEFGTNVLRSGGVASSLPSFSKANHDLEVTPLAMARTCADGAQLGPDDREKIPAGASVTFTGTFGPTKVPVAHGIVVVVRYFEEDGSKKAGRPTDLLAPFGDFPATG